MDIKIIIEIIIKALIYKPANYMNIAYLHSNMNISNYIVNIVYKKIIYIIKINFSNIVKNVI